MSGSMYPFSPEPGVMDRVVARAGTLPMRCPVCGALTLARGFSENLRETGCCRGCGATNRNRQLALIAARAASEQTGRPIRDLAALSTIPGFTIYNTEASGALHDTVHSLSGYECSEYFGPKYLSGDIVDGVRHEDLMALSFDDSTLDQVWSSDVFEHVPDPYQGHREVHRVLRPLGHHVFTVPFHPTGYLDSVRARLGDDGELELLAEPLYHEDPIAPDGVLVYTIFSLEMVVRLAELGFATRMYRLWAPWWGIVGANAVVFDAVKQA
ncbi:MAG: class I SAM-dependent methyltransferase [Acidimicrobiia bacterium]